MHVKLINKETKNNEEHNVDNPMREFFNRSTNAMQHNMLRNKNWK